MGMTPAEGIRAGRALLYVDGWTKGRRRNEDGKMCVRGAVSQAMTGRPSEQFCPSRQRPIDQAFAALDEASRRVTRSWELPACVVTYNDVGGTTFDDIVELTEIAEKIAEERWG